MKSSVQEYFLLMVEAQIKKNVKMSLPDAYEAAVSTWHQMHEFNPPYSSFDAFRKFREKRAKRGRSK